MRARLSPDTLFAGLPSASPVAVVADGARTIVGLGCSSMIAANGADALAALDRITHGWWAGYLAYDLGRTIERIPEINAPTMLPDVVFGRFDTRLVIEPDGEVTVEGSDTGLADLSGGEGRSSVTPLPGPWTSSLDRPSFERGVRTIHEHLVAGDCYQVNLTRRLTIDATPDPIALFTALRHGNPAPHAALLRLADVAVVSASPERFLRVDGRYVQTRPIKGTAADPSVLRASAKDRAENVMIVDLARNDLGRVCEYGSVTVPELFAIEEHPGLHHLVSTVEGVLREDVTIGALIGATFPPASVTGCPKPRVLRIIEEIEPVRRGVYCGAVGFIDADRGVCDLNVAIRTFTIGDARTSFGVGAGIVADSDPAAEWEETELKARRLLGIAASAG